MDLVLVGQGGRTQVPPDVVVVSPRVVRQRVGLARNSSVVVVRVGVLAPLSGTLNYRGGDLIARKRHVDDLSRRNVNHRRRPADAVLLGE